MNDKINYNSLLKLFSKYEKLVNTIINNVNDVKSDGKVDKLEDILSEVERKPLSWRFYSKQKIKFSHEFEDLILFISY